MDRLTAKATPEGTLNYTWAISSHFLLCTKRASYVGITRGRPVS